MYYTSACIVHFLACVVHSPACVLHFSACAVHFLACAVHSPTYVLLFSLCSAFLSISTTLLSRCITLLRLYTVVVEVSKLLSISRQILTGVHPVFPLPLIHPCLVLCSYLYYTSLTLHPHAAPSRYTLTLHSYTRPVYSILAPRPHTYLSHYTLTTHTHTGRAV